MQETQTSVTTIERTHHSNSTKHQWVKQTSLHHNLRKTDAIYTKLHTLQCMYWLHTFQSLESCVTVKVILPCHSDLYSCFRVMYGHNGTMFFIQECSKKCFEKTPIILRNPSIMTSQCSWRRTSVNYKSSYCCAREIYFFIRIITIKFKSDINQKC